MCTKIVCNNSCTHAQICSTNNDPSCRYLSSSSGNKNSTTSYLSSSSGNKDLTASYLPSSSVNSLSLDNIEWSLLKCNYCKCLWRGCIRIKCCYLVSWFNVVRGKRRGRHKTIIQQELFDKDVFHFIRETENLCLNIVYLKTIILKWISYLPENENITQIVCFI